MSDKALVIFTPSGKRGMVEKGTTVLAAARQIGVDLDSVCGGRGICSKCQVAPGFGQFDKHGLTVSEDALSEWNAVEARYDEKRGLAKGRRLGCQATVEGDVVIDVPPESQVHKQVVRKAAATREITMDPATRLFYVEVREPDMHEPSGDLQRVREALAKDWDVRDAEAPASLLRKLQTALRKGKWTLTVAVWQDHRGGRPVLIDCWPGYYEERLYGLAIDLGSTTIAAHLTDLRNGQVVASSGVMNPQIRFGEDLMSRVSYAMMNPGGDVEMTDAVRAAINDLARELAAEAEIATEQLVEAVIVCNPVMHHLVSGDRSGRVGASALRAGDLGRGQRGCRRCRA